MLTPGPRSRVFLSVEPVDMRAGVDRLAGAVRRLGMDPLDGHLYLFLSRSRQILKAIAFDGSGWWVLSKRLELGSFGLPPIPEGARQVHLEPHLLAALLHGLDPKAARRRWYNRKQS
ncbi:MAG: IS66 family insertion sequence element accessory protein TnpB [SAR202 cluster bacterium]|nr:IS66 family insertion sequence element accessory protein TnpB [SAR202 cluster bacterium]